MAEEKNFRIEPVDANTGLSFIDDSIKELEKFEDECISNLSEEYRRETYFGELINN